MEKRILIKAISFAHTSISLNYGKGMMLTSVQREKVISKIKEIENIIQQ